MPTGCPLVSNQYSHIIALLQGPDETTSTSRLSCIDVGRKENSVLGFCQTRNQYYARTIVSEREPRVLLRTRARFNSSFSY